MNKKYRKAIIAGNWKMNKLPSESRAFVEELKPLLPRSKKKVCEVILCMPYPFIPIAQRGSKEKRLALGAQDVSAHDSGAFTGEVSAAMLNTRSRVLPSSGTANAASTTARPTPRSTPRSTSCSRPASPR